MWIVCLEGEEFIDILIHFIFFKLLPLVIYYTHLADNFFDSYLVVLTKYISTLLYQSAVGHFIIFNIKYKELKNKVKWFNEVL